MSFWHLCQGWPLSQINQAYLGDSFLKSEISTILFLSSSSHLPRAVLTPGIRKASFSLSTQVPMNPRLSAGPLPRSENPLSLLPSPSSLISLHQGRCRSSATSTRPHYFHSWDISLLSPFFSLLLRKPLFWAPIYPDGPDCSPSWAHIWWDG